MKKYIKFAAFALIAALASCSSDDDVDYTDVGGNVVPKASISRLDRNYDLPLAVFTKDGVTATKVEIYKNDAKTISDPIVLGAKISDATITADGASFNTSKLPSFDEFPVTSGGVTTNTGKTGTFALAIVSTYSDGSTTRATYTLTVGKGIVWKVLDADGLPKTTSSTSGVLAVNYLDPAPVYVYYATVKNGATVVNSVVGEYKINDGAYKALPGAALPITTGKVDVANIIPWSEIAADDEITFKFTVTAGTQTDAISTKIVFADQVFGAETAGTLSNSDTTSQFSFQTGKSYDGADAENAEVTFVDGFGFKKARTDVRIEFVKSTLDYDTTNLFQAEAAFNAATPVTALADLKTNDVVLYKVTRNLNLGTEDKPNWQDVTGYGLIKITDRVAGASSQQLVFSYKEGVLYQVTDTPPVVVSSAK